jgi:hypothetical protein
MEQPEGPPPCTTCGAQNFHGDIFCRQCGEKLPPYCPQCGSVIDSPSKFCHECGARLETQSPVDYTATGVTQNIPPAAGIPEEAPFKSPGGKKSPFGIIAIGTAIVVLLVVLVIGILFILDYIGGSTSTALVPDAPVAEHEPEQNPVETEPPVIVAFMIDPPKITTAESTMATWEVTGADTVTIDHDIGEVAPAGSLSLSPAQSTVYRLTASNDGGSVTRTAAINVIENVRANDIALTPEDVGPDGYQFRHDLAPSMDDTISTYRVNYRLGVESMDNLVVIYTTVSKAVTSFYDIKANHRENVTDIVDIGDRAYYSTIVELLPEETEMYTICFQKNNVYVSVGQASDLDRLIKYARLVESRIQ